MMARDNGNLERAKKRVRELKGYYRHIFIFLLVNGVLLVVRMGVLNGMMPDGFPNEPFFYDWIIGNIAIWGLILLVHTLLVFRHKLTFFKKWEERQIQKYMEEERDQVDKFK